MSNSVAHSHRTVQQVEADFAGRKLAGMPHMLQYPNLSVTPRQLVNKHSPQDIFYALQSVDNLQAFTPLSAPDHLRLRGGASPRQRKQKPEALQQQASQPTRLAKAMQSPKGQQGAHLTQPDLDPLGSTRLPAESSHQYHTSDSVEVSFA